MNVQFSFEEGVLIIVPDSTFEESFLTTLVGDSKSMTCEAFKGEGGAVECLILKPLEEEANSIGDGITVEEVDIMYEELIT